MNLDTLLAEWFASLPAWVPGWQYVAVAGVTAVALLVALALVLRKLSRANLSRHVTTAATVLGMAWSAQGMWDVTVNELKQPALVASVLFVVFEAMLAARMIKAHQYRTDFTRRSRHVQAVWLIACVMAGVVAFGEGWREAPLRLSIPLLVAYGWYMDLTSDDDPGAKPKTSLRWTPRSLGLAIGMLEATARDAQTIDRDRLRNRITRLAFRIEHGTPVLNDLLSRATRLARLKTLADDADIAEVRERLARSSAWLVPSADAEPEGKPKPERRAEVNQDVPPPAPKPAPVRRPQGVHERLGRELRGVDLEADAVAVMRKSVTADQPSGMRWTDLAALYSPPLGQRKAEEFAAKGRKPINGHVPELTNR